MTDTSLPLAGAIAGDTFRNLVRQFSQELCFYRELIQNSLDAGTRQVAVKVEYLDDKGMARAVVSDQGEGMDRTIIDTQLTRLFSSSKEDDFTKIGKFGIGFVSVFAIAPEAVVVDTGRGGEDWRVIFQPSGEFERVRLSTPVEGTTIQVFKKMPKEEFAGFVERSRETIRFWCRHSDVEIDFNGERVNEPFDLQSPLKVRASEQGTEVVVALVPADACFFGFYNGGITLLEGEGALCGSGQLLARFSNDLAGVAFKIKSRYLEHTLTRDNVMQDANFEKAMKVVKRVLSRDIMETVVSRLGQLASGPADPYRQVLNVARPQLERNWPRDARILQCLPPHPPVSLADLTKTRGQMERLLKGVGWTSEAFLAVDSEPGPVTEALAQTSIPVVLGTPEDVVGRLLRQHFRLAQPSLVLAVTEPLPAAEVPSALSAVTGQAVKLLERCGIRFSGVSWATFSETSAVADRPFLITANGSNLVVAQKGSALKEDEKPPLLPQLAAERGRLLVNAGHALPRKLAAAWNADPSAAAYLFAKMICLCDGLHPQMEARLLQHSLEERARV